jgi:hypothetical protein
MPLNVIDNYGKHVGVIVAKFMHKYVVALTNEAVGDYMLPFLDQLTMRAAEAWQCKSMFGKINEDKFLACLKQWIPAIKAEYFQPAKSLSLYALNKDDLYQYGLVKAFPSATYILTEGKFMDDFYNIKLGLSAGRIPGLGLNKGFPALIGEVADLPRIFCSNHSTELKIKTGDTEIDLTLPGNILARKGEEVALELDFVSQKVLRVTNGEVIYHL